MNKNDLIESMVVGLSKKLTLPRKIKLLEYLKKQNTAILQSASGGSVLKQVKP